MTSNHPKILSNIPEGKDLFKAESHQNIANTIIKIIEDKQSTIQKRIIGLEGDWGTGKSNIIKIIEENTKKKFLHFTFDAWTHQESITKNSIVEELYYFLTTSNVIDKDSLVIYDNSKKWSELKENLFKKTSFTHNTTKPKIKDYWTFGLLAVLSFAFLNFLYTQFFNTDLNSEYYFMGGEPLKKFWIVTLIPLVFILIAINKIRKEYFSKNKSLFDLDLIGEMIYLFSGEKLESTSTQNIIENEPENIEFKKFLYAVDKELNDKVLIFTIDNIDRLTKEKVKNIWSIINVFFAESNSPVFLKNIWLIIPYDQTKVLKSFDNEEIGMGLLEKTFALTFKVPPPLISNWELFFDFCFNKAFDKVQIDEKAIEIEILKKIFHHYEKNITPRKIINFINQISTYYLQNSSIKLRYFSIVILCSEKLFEGNINENIIDRNAYLNKLDNLFIEDDTLELNLSKIIYGLSNDKDAEEALLLNEINALLTGSNEFNDKITNIPSFTVYFYKYFKEYIEKNRASKTTDSDHFKVLTKILFGVQDSFKKNNQLNFYKGLWEFYLQELFNNEFTSFNKTHEGIITFCSKSNSIRFIKKFIKNHSIIESQSTGRFTIENESEYITFLRNLENFLETTKKYSFNDIELTNFNVSIKFILDNTLTNKIELKKYKLVSTDEEFKKFFSDRILIDSIEFTNISKYKNEIVELQDVFKIDFIAKFLNNLKSYKFSSIEEIETIIFLSRNLKSNESINILNKFETISLNSLVKLINDSNETTNNFSRVFIITFINSYSNGNEINSNVIFEQFLKKIDKNQVNHLINEFENFKEFDELINIIKISLQFKELNNLKILSIKLLERKKVELNQENFNWLLQNFSSIKNEIFNEKEDLLYNFINEKSSKLECKIDILDAEMINSSRKKLNLKLIKLTNEYLINYINSHPTFLQYRATTEIKLFYKLLTLGKLDTEIYNFLYQPYINLTLSNSILTEKQEFLVNKIKLNLEKSKIKPLIEADLSRLITRNNIYLVSPEIFDFFDQIKPQQKLQILKILVDKPEFYNIELIHQVQILKNLSLINALKIKLTKHSNIELKENAIKKGLISPSPK